jgi:hypothetical protein
MALGDDAGSAATGFLVIGPPDRRLGAFVERLSLCTDGTLKPTRTATRAQTGHPPVSVTSKSMSVGALVPTVGSFGRTWKPVTLWGLGDSAAPETSL